MPDVPVIVMTAYGSIEDAVSAMKEGALDFLAKPVDPDHLLLIVARALEQRRLVTENLLLKEELAVAPRRAADDRRGCRRCARSYASLQRAAATDTTVLLEGESGTGKELFARSLHALSTARRCAVRRHQLRGDSREPARDRAVRLREGRVHRRRRSASSGKFELAHRGTLFLDEIGDMPLTLQAKMLRVLEEKRFERVGGTAPVQVDVRLVAATNRGLKAAVAGAAVPRGSLLPALGVPDRRPAAARTAGRHPAAGPVLRRALLPRAEKEAPDAVAGGRRAACRRIAGRVTSASCRTASSGR